MQNPEIEVNACAILRWAIALILALHVRVQLVEAVVELRQTRQLIVVSIGADEMENRRVELGQRSPVAHGDRAKRCYRPLSRLDLAIRRSEVTLQMLDQREVDLMRRQSLDTVKQKLEWLILLNRRSEQSHLVGDRDDLAVDGDHEVRPPRRIGFHHHVELGVLLDELRVGLVDDRDQRLTQVRHTVPRTRKRQIVSHLVREITHIVSSYHRIGIV